ncbi:protein FAR1-RELATED SEQUENCE 6-like [Chenopodium quinoa]|uniref:protein FAR1-RELATED SEQUENCE 6-like n=1 Tax=Chenopodium quinoa TaxID=63459 RepID=UPI000B799064|nr:protein FAR1-RELATED SEQUENCE 6-like [Chenopodium quinoa]
MKKLGQKLGALSNYQDVKEELQHVIYNNITLKEFVDSWWEVVKKFKLQDFEFYDWLEGLESRANDEQDADANSARYVRPLLSEFRLERKFQKLYTDAKFVEVQNQCNRVAYVTPVEPKKLVSHIEEEHVFSHRVWIYCKKKRREVPSKDRLKEYTVLYNTEKKEAYCDCRHFECHRIVCRHIIKILDMNGVSEVPPMYILDRCRKDISRKHTLTKVAYHDASKTEEVMRYDKLMLALEPVVMHASSSDEAVEVLMDMIQLMSIKVDELSVLAQGSGQGSGGDERPSCDLEVVKQAMPPTPKTPSSVNKGSIA